ncbi:MAG TPA: L-erythro-3,5-diaminohexanoate dehydrogenase [Myxococcales bacterium]|nr:L-erythro-3,5-diaminohexanoate dehydrogenase [Myxococcales bacterium]
MSDPYGLRRVVRPKGALPQQAEVLDPHLPLGPDELSIEVERLNVDAASFRQLAQEAGGDAQRISARVAAIVSARGKMHNPVTGSGGMLIGRVAEVGPAHPAASELKPGDRIATLVSLTLTPLALQEIERVHLRSERLDVRGRAILFATGIWARLPEDLPEAVALAVLDVCGAPAWVARLARPGERVLVLGAGKSGSLACAQARKNGAHVTALDYRPEAPRMLVHERLADAAIAVDATQPLEVYARAREAGLFDLVVNCASVPGTEMGSILAARDGGEVLFFSMATSFTAAALGAEGAGKDVRLTIGNGYARGHAELALELLRSTPALQRLFAARVG